MAKRIDDNDPNLIGKLVYEPFNPAKCGKIIKDLGLHSHREGFPTFRVVTVQWIKGNQTDAELSNLNDFDALIEDHKRKYEKFILLADKLKEYYE